MRVAEAEALAVRARTGSGSDVLVHNSPSCLLRTSDQRRLPVRRRFADPCPGLAKIIDIPR